MEKIKSLADARKVAEKMQDDADLKIQLFDKYHIKHTPGKGFVIYSSPGSGWIDYPVSFEEAVKEIYDCRRFIRSSGQLEGLDL